MNLKLIRLSGFKSFVDPTVIPLRSHMNAIVGPNGCGKSNVVDAIRWVIGESSAKQLRGQAMSDVIFNGTTNRKSVSKASIELLFDNSDGKMGGEFANYREISIRRELSRDGQSNYYLNGTHCRRRDVIDLFLGTGLGPRSYAIIEQGMISRLIEAKPEELRAHLEEAAGISKYKERRRETENRMRHTEENLERLNDLIDEIEKQIKHLKRQANAAERYKDLKQEEHLLQAEIKALSWQELEVKVAELQKQLNEAEVVQEQLRAEVQSYSTQLLQLTEAKEALQVDRDQAQQQRYQLETSIAKLEQQINHHKQQITEWTAELDNVLTLYQQGQNQLEQSMQQVEDLKIKIIEIKPQEEELNVKLSESKEQLEQAESAWQHMQQQWEQFQQQSATILQDTEIAKTKVNHKEQRINQLNEQHQRIRLKKEEIKINELQIELKPLDEEVNSQTERLRELNQELENSQTAIHNQRQHNAESKQILLQTERELHDLQAEQATLKAAQQLALGQRDDHTVTWLQQQGLQDKPRLGQCLQVSTGWEVAAETALAGLLESVCVEQDLTSLGQKLTELNAGHLSVIKANPALANNTSTTKATTLASLIQSDWPLAQWLDGIYVADDLAAAERLLPELTATESVITRDGIWLGSHWIKYSKATDSEEGVLKREQRLNELKQDIEQKEQACEQQKTSWQQGEQQLLSLENTREEQHQSYQEETKVLTQLQAKLSNKSSHLESQQREQQRLTEELTACEQQLNETKTELEQTQAVLAHNEARCIELQTEREALLSQRESKQKELTSTREQTSNAVRQADAFTLQLQSAEKELSLLEQNQQRDKEHLTQLSERKQSLETHINQTRSPIDELEETLQQRLSEHLEANSALEELEQKLQSQQEEWQSFTQQEQRAAEQLDAQMQKSQQLQMEQQAFTVRQATIKEQLAEGEWNINELLEKLAQQEDVELTVWQERLNKVSDKISRLGNINLAAIEEYQTATERRQYLDQQKADLEEALGLLTTAIAKIDRETRAKFRETFDKVNQGLQTLFPRVFGGGQAQLRLTEDNVLTAGVLIQAQPPGKRNATIHMLSGGEKALTAISLVFSMFQLNPAPFCVLDEVDAPLDDANVSRFCQLVKEMSLGTQFIVISHNKVTISMADQLMGVTMQEAGVSRLVSVDMAEAVAMAEQ